MRCALVTVVTGLALCLPAVGAAECSRCHTRTGRWCSHCTPGEICTGCRDRIWPRGCENPDFFKTPLDQESRWEFGTRVSDLSATLGSGLMVLETRRFRVITDIDHAKAHEMATLAERSYDEMRRTFHVGPTETLFGGKCQIFCFEHYRTFRKFADTVEKVKMLGCSGGFTIVRAFEPKIALFTQGMRQDQLHRTLVHELVHVVLGLYAKQRRLKDWLQEGAAQHFEFMYKPRTSRVSDWEARVKSYAAEGRLTPAADLIEMDIAPIDRQGYAESWSLVSFMIKKGGIKFGRFLNCLRDDVPQAQALERTFGVTPDELGERWKKYLEKL